MSRNTCDWKDDRCPRCFSFGIEHEDFKEFDFDKERGFKKGSCNNCGLEFYRMYNTEYSMSTETFGEVVSSVVYDSTEWDAIQSDKRHGEVTPFSIASKGSFTLEEFENAKYDPVERNKKRYEEYLRMEEQVFEKAAQMGIWWIPFERRKGWWGRKRGFVITDSVMVHKDGTYHRVECRENELRGLLESFIRVRRKNEN